MHVITAGGGRSGYVEVLLFVLLAIYQSFTQCITTEQPPQSPCARCTKKDLVCEYLAAPDREDYPAESAESEAGELPTHRIFPSRPTAGNSTMSSPKFSRGLGSTPPFPRPGSRQMSQSSRRSSHAIPPSNQHPIYTGYPSPGRGQYTHASESMAGSSQTMPLHTPYYASPHDLNRQQNRASFALPPPSLHLYEIQIAHARQYLANRDARSSHQSMSTSPQPTDQPYSIQEMQFEFPDDMMLPEYDWPHGPNSG